jgi:AcrR family transcriptional regulator
VPRERFLNLPQAERDALLAIALRQFAARGLDGASLNEILGEAGISKGAYYYYFDDKEDLFATVIEHELDTMLARAPMPSFGAVTRARFWPMVEHQVALWAKLLSTSRPALQVLLHVDEAMRRRPRFARIMATGYALYRPVITAGQRVGCIRTDLPVDELLQLVEASDAVIDRIFVARSRKSVSPAAFARHVELAFDTFRRLLEAAPPRRRRRG